MRILNQKSTSAWPNTWRRLRMTRAAFSGCVIILATGIFTPGNWVAAQQSATLLFDPKTGFRVGRYRSPTPNAVPNAEVIPIERVRVLIKSEAAVLIDVMSVTGLGPDPIDGKWRVSKPRHHIPGSVWLPEVGRGTLDQVMLDYFRTELVRLSGGDYEQAFVFYCVADCWMSWNATQRAASFGYTTVYWFPEGSDGWRENDLPLANAIPVPVNIEH